MHRSKLHEAGEGCHRFLSWVELLCCVFFRFFLPFSLPLKSELQTLDQTILALKFAETGDYDRAGVRKDGTDFQVAAHGLDEFPQRTQIHVSAALQF